MFSGDRFIRVCIDKFHATDSDQHHSSPSNAQASTKIMGIEILITFNMSCLCEGFTCYNLHSPVPLIKYSCFPYLLIMTVRIPWFAARYNFTRGKSIIESKGINEKVTLT